MIYVRRVIWDVCGMSHAVKKACVVCGKRYGMLGM